jgi:hypothetical protein
MGFCHPLLIGLRQDTATFIQLKAILAEIKILINIKILAEEHQNCPNSTADGL